MHEDAQPHVRALAAALRFGVLSGVPLVAVVRGLADSLRPRLVDWLPLLYPLPLILSYFFTQRSQLLMAKELAKAADRMEAGQPLAEALSGWRMRRFLPAYFLPTLAAGEAHGNLPEALELLGKRIEHDRPTRRAWQGVTSYLNAYFWILAAMAFFAVGPLVVRWVNDSPRRFWRVEYLGSWSLYLVRFVFGAFEMLLFSDGLELFIWLFAFAAWLLAVYAFMRLLKSRPAWWLGAQLLRILPVGRRFVMDNALRECAYGFAAWLRLGCDWPDAVQRVRNAHPDPWIRRRLHHFQTALTEGVAWDEAWRRQGWGSPMIDLLVVNGAATDDAPGAMERVAAVLEQRIEQRVSYLGLLLRPVAVACVALVAGAVVFGTFGNLIDLMEAQMVD